ncbi:cytochrome P450 [Nocardia australiensis]|uniref:cytochrome P450 n=1 Tax=Nocardia australiensis TaxID=2887191 RepID=UPI001D154BBB|nr:cytochrome P450 [Nocardia australiensis]
MTLSLPATRVAVTDIPHLDTPDPFVRRLPTEPDNIPRIELPSGHTAICLSGYADVRALMFDDTASRALCNVDGGPSFMPTNWAPEVLINLDAPVHGVMRRFVSHEFSARAMAEWVPIVQGLTLAACAEFEHADAPDLVRDVFTLVPAQTVCTLLGVPLERARWMNGLGRIVQRADRDDIDGIGEAWGQLWGWVEALIAGEAEHNDTGLISIYKRRRAEREYATDVDAGLLAGTLMGVILGGDNNVATMLSKTTYAALAHPQLYRRVTAAPEREVPKLVEEILRLMPLGTPGSFPRQLVNPLSTSFGELPAGRIVYPHINAANRDPAVFADPLAIDLDRPPNKHLQYGYGMHRCMGSALAQMALITVLRTVVSRYPSLALAAQPEEVPWDFGIGLRRPSELAVTL